MPAPREREGFTRDKDLERSRGLSRPADSEMDATERGADRRPDENMDHPAEVDEDPVSEPDRDTLSRSGQ